MISITVSAPGKLMLVGEHAVVYGHPCIVTAVDQRLTVIIEQTDNQGVIIDAPQMKDTRFVDAAINHFKQSFSEKVGGIKIKTQCPFSGKFGFGSSASVTVATLKALCEYYGKKADNREIFDLAYQVILAVQRVGSGFDVAAASFGKTLYYVKAGKILEEIGNSSKNLPIVVGYTGIKSNTVEIVKQVARAREQNSQKINAIFVQIDRLVNQAKKAFLEKDWLRLGSLMDQNQEYLRQLGVSSKELENLIKTAKSAGAWGAKLSGAGGGDCMVALVGNQKRLAVEKAIAQAGGEVLPVKLNAEGARVENSNDQIPNTKQ